MTFDLSTLPSRKKMTHVVVALRAKLTAPHTYTCTLWSQTVSDRLERVADILRVIADR